MPDNITGALNEPISQPGVTNQGGVVDSDNDLNDDPVTGTTGHVDVASFPGTVPAIGDQKKKAEERAASSPKGGDATAQAYRAEVPFSGSTLSLGSGASAGGAGAAITTAENVFVGATGVLGMQSLAAFTGQTKAGMGLYSVGGTSAHSQSQFQIYAGGGTAPGDCGSGGPAGTVDKGKPAEMAEKITNGVCNSLGVVKASNDLYNAATSWKGGVSDYLTAAKGLTDLGNKGSAIVMSVAGTDKDTAKGVAKWSDTTSGTLNILGGLAKVKDDPAGALSSVLGAVSSVSGAQGGSGLFNPERPVPGSDGATSKVPKPPGAPAGAAAAGAAAPLDIEERAAAKIHMSCNIKVGGNAPEGIDWKTAGAFLANAVAAVDFATTNWGAFAAAMFKVRAVVLVDVKCRKFDMKALATGTFISAHTTIKASTMSTLDGATEVTKTLTVLKHSTLRDELLVKKNALINENLTVKQKTKVDKDAKFHKNCTFKGNVTANGRYVVKGNLRSVNQGKLG